jgi:ribosomal protein S18 acetylase RimI-like enzyme
MRRTPQVGWGPDGLVVFTLEDLGSPAGEDPKAVIEVRREVRLATVVGGGVPEAHRGRGHGRRLARQAMAALRAEGCTTVRIAEPTPPAVVRALVELGFERVPPSAWELAL